MIDVKSYSPSHSTDATSGNERTAGQPWRGKLRLEVPELQGQYIPHVEGFVPKVLIGNPETTQRQCHGSAQSLRPTGARKGPEHFDNGLPRSRICGLQSRRRSLSFGMMGVSELIRIPRATSRPRVWNRTHLSKPSIFRKASGTITTTRLARK
jgi:hypothetical protein